MHLHQVYGDDFALISTVLSKLAKLLIWATLHSEFSLAQDLFPIFNPNFALHQKNFSFGRFELLDSLMTTFCESSQLLVTFLTTQTPNFESFDIYFELIGLIYTENSIRHNLTPLFLSGIPPFIQFIQNFLDDIKLSDWPKFGQTVEKFMILICHSKIEERSKASEYFQILFEFGERLLKGEILQRRLIGAQILDFGIRPQIATNLPIDVLNKFKQNSNVIQILITGDLNLQLLDKISDLLEEFMTPKSLEIFVSRADSSHSSERAEMFSIVERIFQKMGSKACGDFLLRIIQCERPSDHLLNFAARTFPTVEHLENDLSVAIVSRLLNHGCSGISQRSIIDGLAKFADWGIDNPEIQEFIISEAKLRLEDCNSLEFIANLLVKFVAGGADFESAFGHDFIDTIVKQIKKSVKNRECLFRLLIEALNSQREGSRFPKLISDLSENGIDDPFWDFMTNFYEKIFRESDSEMMDGVVKKLIARYSERLEIATLSWLHFLKTFVMSKQSLLSEADPIFQTIARSEDPTVVITAESIILGFLQEASSCDIHAVFNRFESFFSNLV
jgi:hypothetical protein